MTQYAWSELLSVLFSVLNGVCALAALNLTLTYWQRHRTAKVFAYCLAYWSLSLAFFLAGQARLSEPLIGHEALQPTRWISFLLFCIFVLIGQVYEWVELINFLRAKNEALQKVTTTNGGAAARAMVAVDTSVMAAEQAKAAMAEVVKEQGPVGDIVKE